MPSPESVSGLDYGVFSVSGRTLGLIAFVIWAGVISSMIMYASAAEEYEPPPQGRTLHQHYKTIQKKLWPLRWRVGLAMLLHAITILAALFMALTLITSGNLTIAAIPLSLLIAAGLLVAFALPPWVGWFKQIPER